MRIGVAGRRCVCKAARGRGAVAGLGQGFQMCLQCHEMSLKEQGGRAEEEMAGHELSVVRFRGWAGELTVRMT